MKTEKTEIILPSTLAAIDEAATEAARIAAECGMDEGGLFGIDLAVRETVANAVKHGNQFDESKKVTMTFETAPDALVMTIADEGDGFDFAAVPDPTDPENLLKATGRGILFMNNFMDEVAFENAATGGTIVRLTKKL